MISKEELEAVNHIRDYIIELEEEIKDLKEINAEHEKLNGELQHKLTKLEIRNKVLTEIIEGKNIQELGVSDLYKED